jgi:AAA domain/UvrD-like helicase C-terminal domain
MSYNTARQAIAPSESALASSVSAGKHDPTRDVSGPWQPPSSDSNQRPALTEICLDIVAVRLVQRRDGLGCFTVLSVAHPEYREAVCYSAQLPFSVAPGQKLQVRGRRADYQGKPQIIFNARDIQLVSEPADNPDLVSIEVTVGRVSAQNLSRTWKAFRVSAGVCESASGDIPFSIHAGQRLRLRGFKGVHNGKPQLLVVQAEPLPVEYADDRRRIFAQSKIPPRYFDCLVAAFGPDFPTRLGANSDLIAAALPRIRSPMRAKIADACARIEAQHAFPAALRKCGVAEPTVATLAASRPGGLATVTAYDLIDYRSLDENRPRGPRRGLTGGEADKLAQSDYALSFRHFDPQSLERARGHIEHLARERMELRGDVGASISRIVGDLERRFALNKTVSQKAVAVLAEELVFRVDPADPDHLWLAPEARAEASIAHNVHARLAQVPGKAPSRRPAERVTLFPASDVARPIELTDAQRAAAKMALESRISIICGPPGVGKTSVLTSLVKHGGDRVSITALAAAAVQRAREITGGGATTVASLTTDVRRSGNLHLCARPDRLRGLDTLIVDEASMIGSRQLATLLDGCDEARVARVVLCGDPDQLPPIQAGSPFADMLRSEIVPTARLTQIFRSEAGSGVQNLVESVRSGEFAALLSRSGPNFPAFGEGVEFLSGDRANADAICAKYRECSGLHGEPDTAVLSPFKSDDFGVHALNMRLRAAVGFDTPIPRVGEIVMCVQNEADAGDGFRLLNGMRLIVADFDGKSIALRHLSSRETKIVTYRPHAHGPAETIVWGRAATVHKYQGSEAAAVIMVIPPDALRLIEREPHIFDAANFYTGVSRAKKRVAIMGALDQLPALLKHGSRRRITTLERILREARHG